MNAPFETSDLLADLPRISHGFFGRRGGISTGVFASLNVSETAGDVPGRVIDNRAIAANELGFPLIALATLTQTHSNRILTLAAPPPLDSRPDADAMVTRLPNILLGILTADCTPILLADREAGVIAAAHAGWKGARDDIIGNTVKAMAALGAEPERIVAAIGPTISRANYEVGPEFAAEFLGKYPGSAHLFSMGENGREHFDLPGFVADRLRQAGVTRIDDLKRCTYAEPEVYFSHRYATHQKSRTGRQIAMIGRV